MGSIRSLKVRERVLGRDDEISLTFNAFTTNINVNLLQSSEIVTDELASREKLARESMELPGQEFDEPELAPRHLDDDDLDSEDRRHLRRLRDVSEEEGDDDSRGEKDDNDPVARNERVLLGLSLGEQIKKLTIMIQHKLYERSVEVGWNKLGLHRPHQFAKVVLDNVMGGEHRQALGLGVRDNTNPIPHMRPRHIKEALRLVNTLLSLEDTSKARILMLNLLNRSNHYRSKPVFKPPPGFVLGVDTISDEDDDNNAEGLGEEKDDGSYSNADEEREKEKKHSKEGHGDRRLVFTEKDMERLDRWSGAETSLDEEKLLGKCCRGNTIQNCLILFFCTQDEKDRRLVAEIEKYLKLVGRNAERGGSNEGRPRVPPTASRKRNMDGVPKITMDDPSVRVNKSVAQRLQQLDEAIHDIENNSPDWPAILQKFRQMNLTERREWAQRWNDKVDSEEFMRDTGLQATVRSVQKNLPPLAPLLKEMIPKSSFKDLMELNEKLDVKKENEEYKEKEMGSHGSGDEEEEKQEDADDSDLCFSLVDAKPSKV